MDFFNVWTRVLGDFGGGLSLKQWRGIAAILGMNI